MRALLDINMLIALFDAEHTSHAKALAWWSHHRGAGWATSPLTQNGFLRVVCLKSYSRPKPLPEAFDLLSAATGRPDHEQWSDDMSLLDTERIERRHVLSPLHLTDVYLLALAVKHGGRLVTLDRGIPLAAVRGARAEHLAVV